MIAARESSPSPLAMTEIVTFHRPPARPLFGRLLALLVCALQLGGDGATLLSLAFGAGRHARA